MSSVVVPDASKLMMSDALKEKIEDVDIDSMLDMYVTAVVGLIINGTSTVPITGLLESFSCSNGELEVGIKTSLDDGLRVIDPSYEMVATSVQLHMGTNVIEYARTFNVSRAKVCEIDHQRHMCILSLNLRS